MRTEPLFRKIRPPVKTHGGKYYLAMQLRDTMDDARKAIGGANLYASVFGGGWSDGLNVGAYGQLDWYNDADPIKVNLFEQLRDDAAGVYVLLNAINYTEGEFLRAQAIVAAYRVASWEEIKSLPGVSRSSLAVAYIVSSRFSRGGQGKSFAWSDRERGGQPGDVNAWDTFLRFDFDRIAVRCRNLVTSCSNYDVVLSQLTNAAFGGTKVMAYLDPPYPKKTRTAPEAYGRHEMPDDDELSDPARQATRNSHRHLLGMVRDLNAAGAAVAISSYKNALYDSELEGFYVDAYELPNNAGQGKTKQRRTEVVYRNFARQGDASPTK